MSLIEECYASGRGELVDTIEARKEGGTTMTRIVIPIVGVADAAGGECWGG